MKFTTHSSDGLFGKRMTRYAEEKLQRPILRHHFDSEDVEIKAEAKEVSTGVELRVAVYIPGFDAVHFSVSEEEINGSIDVAADKLERALRSLKDKRRSRRGQNNNEDYTEEFGEDDYLTDGEEDVLREMGALDDILGL